MQELAVALIVAAASAYLFIKYMPKGLRRSLSARLASYPRIARWFGSQASCGSGCGSGCDTCGSCDTEPQANPRTIPIRVHRD